MLRWQLKTILERFLGSRNKIHDSWPAFALMNTADCKAILMQTDHQSWAPLRKFVGQADGRLLFQGAQALGKSGLCSRKLVVNRSYPERPQSTDHLKGPVCVGQKVAAMVQTDMQLVLDNVSSGFESWRQQVYSTLESMLNISCCHRVPILCK